MAKRKGLGKGKGRGWKNIVASDSYRHELARRGIKTKVSVTKRQRKSLKKQLLPLIKNKTISNYSLIETPRLNKKEAYRIIYGHDSIRKHRDIIIEELKDRGIDYYVMPRETNFLLNGKQDKEGYQIIIDVNKKEIEGIETYFRQKTVNRDEFVTVLDATLNPTIPIWEVIPLQKSYVIPDIRIQDKTKYPDFKLANKIIKRIDEDTDLVILSIGAKNTKKVRDALKGEKEENVLIQNYFPFKHSLYKKIKIKR